MAPKNELVRSSSTISTAERAESSSASSRFLASSVTAAVAETCTLPADVAKVRLQVQVSARGVPMYSGLIDCLQKTARAEGLAACWKGLQPALIRQICYSSLVLVLYEPVRDAVAAATGSDGAPNFMQRLLAGGTAGALSITVFNPTEVLKTQMQTAARATTMGSVVRGVYREGGVLSFWAGLQPNIARTFLVNAAELGTYDEAKHRLIPYVGDNAVAHVGASGIAGVTSALTSTPADVVTTTVFTYARAHYEPTLSIAAPGEDATHERGGRAARVFGRARRVRHDRPAGGRAGAVQGLRADRRAQGGLVHRLLPRL